MKDIVLRITGKTVMSSEPGHQGDVVEFTTTGTYARRGGIVRIAYPETELSGMDGCTTAITITEGKVSMRRSGAPLAMDTVMEFEKGTRFEGTYETPFGSVGMEILTNDITVIPLPGGDVKRVAVDYNLSLRGLMESQNLLDLEILKYQE